MEVLHSEYMLEVSVEDIKAKNGGFADSIAIPEKREEFFNGLGVANLDVYRHMKKYMVRKPVTVRLYRNLRSALSKIKRRMTR